MGFLDKVKGTVASAKDGLDRSGLLDQARGVLATGESSEGGAGTAPGPDETQLMVDAIRRGAVDPRMLLDAVEVASIAGAEVGGPRVAFNGDYVYATFDTAGKHREQYQVAVCHAMDDDAPWDAEEHWTYVTETYGTEAVTPIAGLGDDAFRMDAYVWVKARGRVLFTEVVAERLDEPTRTARAEQLARGAAARF